MKNYTIYEYEGSIAWTQEIQDIANLAPASVLDIISRLSTMHNANIATRIWQELMYYDDELVDILTDGLSIAEFFDGVSQFLELVELHIRVGDELPLFLLGDFLNLKAHDSRAYDALNAELRSLQIVFISGEYDKVTDASTDFFVAIHNAYHTGIFS